MQSILPPLVLTLKLGQTTFEQVNTLQQQYFPPGAKPYPGPYQDLPFPSHVYENISNYYGHKAEQKA